jgi:hypothetical protein
MIACSLVRGRIKREEAIAELEGKPVRFHFDRPLFLLIFFVCFD